MVFVTIKVYKEVTTINNDIETKSRTANFNYINLYM